MKKKHFLFRGLYISLLVLLIAAQTHAQTVTPPTAKAEIEVSAAELAKLKAEVIANMNDVKTHEAYLKAFGSADAVQEQYDTWIAKNPSTTAIPLAIGEKYFNSESPKATKYLVKVIDLEPKNTSVLNMLSLDALRWGDRKKSQQYLESAANADPQNVEYAFAGLFQDGEAYPDKVWEFVKKYPKDDRSVSALHLLGYYTSDIKKRIAVWEKLRELYAQTTATSFQVAMARLMDAYIQTGQDEKAIGLAMEMAPKAPARLNFAAKLNLVKIMDEIETKKKNGQYADIREKTLNLNSKSKFLFEVGSRVMLLKATVLDATGATQAAYDSLITFQSKTPDINAREALKVYAKKLKKTDDQVNADVSKVVYQNAKPAPDWEASLYTSDKKVSAKSLKGKLYLITFWFPGCGPCRAEMPHLQKVLDKYKGKIEYYGVNIAREQDEYVLPFLKGTKYSFIPLRGTPEWAMATFKVRAEPSNFIIDQAGNIIYSNFTVNASNEDTFDLMLQLVAK